MASYTDKAIAGKPADTRSMREKPIGGLLYGGTLDAEPYYDTPEFKAFGRAPERVTPLEESMVPSALRHIDYGHLCATRQMTMVDSNDFIGNPMAAGSMEKAAILTAEMERAIAETPQRDMFISIGTDGLAAVVRKMDNHAKQQGKAIIFWGMMEPFSHGFGGTAETTWPKGEVPHGSPAGLDTLQAVVKTLREYELPAGAYALMPDEKGKPTLFHANDDLRKVIVPTGEGRDRRFFAGTPVDMSRVTKRDMPLILQR